MLPPITTRKEKKMSIYDGHRVYNGCPDDTLQKRWDEEEKTEKKLGICLTWHNTKQRYSVATPPPMMKFMPGFYHTKQEAYEAAIKWKEKDNE